MIPNKNQSIFDAPKGFVDLDCHSLNPFSLAKLTTYFVMCKAYGFKPTLNAFRRFLNLCPAGDWLTFSKRGEADVPYLFIKPFTNIRAGKGKFFYIQYTIVPAEYNALVDKANIDDRKFFKDPLPYIV
ncbi:hypothetical protein Tco_1539470 [Tanacetum coccineum]